MFQLFVLSDVVFIGETSAIEDMLIDWSDIRDDWSGFFLTSELLKWNCSPSSFGTVQYQFKGYQDKNMKYMVGQQYRAPVVRLDDCAGWPVSLLVAMAIHFQFQQDKYLMNKSMHAMQEFFFLHWE